MLLPLVQPVLCRCRRHRKPLLQVCGLELIRRLLPRRHPRPQAREQLLAAAVEPLPGVGLRRLLAGLQGLGPQGWIEMKRWLSKAARTSGGSHPLACHQAQS